MQFVILCKDKPGSLDLRLRTREAHLAYIKEQDALVLGAGPFLNDKDEMVGSMLMVEAASEAEARRFAENDPYARAGLFETVEFRRWRWRWSIKPPAR